MRLIVAVALLTAATFTARAAEPVRVIEISKDNAARSAAIIASAKSPFIGQSPQILTAAARNSRARASEAELRISHVERRAANSPIDRALVRVITPGADALAVRSYLVPRE
jgi:hypothetical protein